MAASGEDAFRIRPIGIPIQVTIRVCEPTVERLTDPTPVEDINIMGRKIVVFPSGEFGLDHQVRAWGAVIVAKGDDTNITQLCCHLFVFV
jgi:hypothetical protein